MKFSPPDLTEQDRQAVNQVLESGWITTGPVTAQFEAAIADWSGTAHAVATSSATAALELALRTLGVGPGDDVLVPAYTYTASASVVHRVGARAVLVDSAPDGYHVTRETLERALTPATRAVVVVDIGGAPCAYDQIQPWLESLPAPDSRGNGILEALGRIPLISDAAHSFGGRYASRPVGSLADFTCYSFHAVKNLTTAEGGAITWRLPTEIDSARLYQGTRTATLHGQTKDALSKSQAGAWEYDIEHLGMKCNLTDLQAALGLSQLGRYADSLARRAALAKLYAQHLPASVGTLSDAPAQSESTHHLAMVQLSRGTVADRNALIARLAGRDIPTNVHYKPLPLLTAYRDLGHRPEDVPNAVGLYEREITLPLHTLLSDDDVEQVCVALGQEFSR